MMQGRFGLQEFFKLIIKSFPMIIPTICPLQGDINNATINPLKRNLKNCNSKVIARVEVPSKVEDVIHECKPHTLHGNHAT
jgi:hypothetical protein